MEPATNRNYWNACGKAGIIFGFIVFLTATIGGYLTIHSEPSGSLISTSIVASALGCLFSAFGGATAVWFFINEHGPEIKIGKGAVIGLITGIGIALVAQFFSMIWPLIDGAYLENFQDAMIANIELMDMLPQAQKEEMIDAVYSQTRNIYSAASIIQGLLLGMLSHGLLNLLSGLLGAKIMGKEPVEEF